MENNIKWLRVSYWTGAIGDFVLANVVAVRDGTDLDGFNGTRTGELIWGVTWVANGDEVNRHGVNWQRQKEHGEYK